MGYKCKNCDEDKEFETKKAVRTHQISKGHYNKENFEEEIEEIGEGKEQDVTETDEPSEEETEEEGLEGVEEEKEEAEDLEHVEEDGMDSMDLDDLDLEDEDDEDEDEEEDDSSGKGLSRQVNEGVGQLSVIGLEEGEKKDRMRKDVKETAEAFGLGENAKWYYEEEMKGETDDPKKALFGSAIAVAIVVIANRPDLRNKLKNGVQNARNNGGEE